MRRLLALPGLGTFLRTRLRRAEKQILRDLRVGRAVLSVRQEFVSGSSVGAGPVYAPAPASHRHPD